MDLRRLATISLHRQFFTLDPVRIAAALDLPTVAPFTLGRARAGAAGRLPSRRRHLPRPPNNHLSYALTWYGLAAALVVVFGTWARQRLTA